MSVKYSLFQSESEYPAAKLILFWKADGQDVYYLALHQELSKMNWLKMDPQSPFLRLFRDSVSQFGLKTFSEILKDLQNLHDNYQKNTFIGFNPREIINRLMKLDFLEAFNEVEEK